MPMNLKKNKIKTTNNKWKTKKVNKWKQIDKWTREMK